MKPTIPAISAPVRPNPANPASDQPHPAPKETTAARPRIVDWTDVSPAAIAREDDCKDCD